MLNVHEELKASGVLELHETKQAILVLYGIKNEVEHYTSKGEEIPADLDAIIDRLDEVADNDTSFLNEIEESRRDWFFINGALITLTALKYSGKMTKEQEEQFKALSALFIKVGEAEGF